MSQGGVKKLRLRRIKGPADSLIQKNLQPLKEHVRKKQIAQEAFYSGLEGTSPLIRDDRKESVHQRLGVKQLRIKRNKVAVLGTNTASVIPRKKPFNRFNNHKSQRIFSAQQRLNRIRAQQAQQMQSNQFQVNGRPKKVLKLQRAVGNDIQATNLTVQVQNSNANIRPHNSNIRQNRRFKQILNMKIQEQIRQVQTEYTGQQVLLPMAITPVCTLTTMHERFGAL